MYFNQQMGAPQAVCWLKSFFDIKMQAQQGTIFYKGKKQKTKFQLVKPGAQLSNLNYSNLQVFLLKDTIGGLK